MTSEKTEDPTPKRVREARAEGQIARSPELIAAAALLSGIWLLRAAGGRLAEAFKDIMTISIASLPAIDPSSEWLTKLFVEDLIQLAPGFGLILGGLLLSGVTVSVAQFGFLWANKRKAFDFNRVNPLQGIKRLVSLQGLTELIKAILKVGVVSWVTYTYLRDRAPELENLIQVDLQTAIRNWLNLASALAVRVGVAYFALAVVDYAYQRWQYNRSLRMSKEEIKEEFKQNEGDPLRRRRIRTEHRRMVRSRMMVNVPNADVVIVNPTHLAVALQYDPEKMSAPRVLAKGAYRIAERIVNIAREHAIPVVQDIPLARVLYKTSEVDQEIPPELYSAMAEVLAYVYRLRGRAVRSAAG